MICTDCVMAQGLFVRGGKSAIYKVDKDTNILLNILYQRFKVCSRWSDGYICTRRMEGLDGIGAQICQKIYWRGGSPELGGRYRDSELCDGYWVA
jgi:hypothetical protein